MTQSKKSTAKKASTKSTPAPRKKPQSKGTKTETRDKILAAARYVFCNYPYHSASIRLIGKLAEIEHPLISYYFPNKAELFISVLQAILKKQAQETLLWLEEVALMSPARGLAVYFDHELEFYRQYPEAYNIIALNIVQAENAEPIPGYYLIEEATKESIKNFIEKVNLNAPEYEVEMFCRVLSNHLVSFLGASKFHASIMNLDPNSIQYYNWVKDTALYTLLPRLEMMVKRA